MQDFNVHRPASLEEAASLLSGGDDAKLLAGGQSLLPLMKLDLAAPTDVVSLAGIDALQGIAVSGGAVRIGAATTHAAVATSADVAQAIPALADLAAGIGDAQVRNRGTLGGSIAHADPVADYPAAVLALGATIVTDRREIAGDAFFTGLFETALDEGEIIVAASFPVPERAAYAKFPNPASKFALVGVMVAQTSDGAVRVAVTGARPSPFRVPELESALTADFSAGALDDLTVASDGFLDDLDARADYRAHLVSVMARRAVGACA
jgi:carbon-monoxide dehydrogenase medium subunit